MWITKADADNYFMASVRKDEWEEIDNDKREQLLEAASRRLDALYFDGDDPASTEPKYMNADATIPNKLRIAVAELALFYASEPTNPFFATDNPRIPALSIETADLPAIVQNAVYQYLKVTSLNVDELEDEITGIDQKAGAINYIDA